MKKIQYLIIIFVSTVYSQNNVLNYEQLKISNISLNLNKNTFLTNIGINQLPADYISELTDETYEKYTSNTNSFYFKDEKIVDFSLNNADYYFMSSNIKVGNHIDVLSINYSNSFSNKEMVNGIGYVIINLQLPSGITADEFIVINYDDSGIINSIHMGEY